MVGWLAPREASHHAASWLGLRPASARNNYYLCDGSWEDAWKHVPQDLVVLNWNYNQHEGRSPRFFAAKGFSQLIMGAGFDTGLDAGQWLRTNPDVPRIGGD